MTRSTALAELSRDHGRELEQARRLIEASGAKPAIRMEAAAVYIEAFFGETVQHFRDEEERVFPLFVRHTGPSPLVDRVLREHMQLHGLVRALRFEAVAGDVRPETLAGLGAFIRDHVRLEERELFPLLETALTEMAPDSPT